MSPIPTSQITGALGRTVLLRPNTSDAQVWSDTYVGLYHVPPESMEIPETVLDLGANIGLTAAHYQALWPEARIMAVEMDEDCCALARLNAPEATVLHHAVSARGGLGSYDPNARAEAFTFEPGGAGRAVRSLTLRGTIHAAFEGPVDFVKMDIESAEWAIFEDDRWAELVRHLLVELHPGGPNELPNDSETLLLEGTRALAALGFEVSRHTHHPRALWATRPR